MNIRIAGLVEESIVDGPGIRYVVFTQGCYHNCKGCHNPNTHNPNGGKNIDTKEIVEKIKRNPLINGLTLSGGEPFLQPEPILLLAKEAKKIGLDVISYSGFTYEQLVDKKDETIDELLDTIDYLIDGKFELDKRSLALAFRGSSNQRIIDLKKTRKNNKIIETDFSDY